MLNSKEKIAITEQLKKCKTAGEAFTWLATNYDLDGVVLGTISKPLLIDGLIKAINLTNPKKL